MEFCTHRPASILDRQPFIPKPSDKPLSEVSNFELHSDRRAREREQFDLQQKQREAELESSKKQVTIWIIIFWVILLCTVTI